MSEIKWIKITTDMFDNEKIRLIDAMPERDTIHYVWMRLLVQAGKTNANGFIYLSDQIPYTEEMLATLFNRSLNSIRLALKVLQNFKMINIHDDNEIKIVNWEKYQNVEGMERIREQTRQRVAKCRKRKKEEKDNVTKSNVTVTEQKEKERDKKKEEDLEVDEEKEKKIDQDENLDEKREKNTKEEDLKDDSKDGQAVQINALVNSEEAGFRLLCYFEQMTGRIRGLNIGALNVAAKEHGEEHVKMAIDKALETNILSMNYINGILRNWRKEGYPKEGGFLNGDSRLTSDGGKFEDVKPPKPRVLTEEERRNSKALI